MSAFHQALLKRHADSPDVVYGRDGVPVKSSRKIHADSRKFYDSQPIVTSCGLCDRVINRGPALWGRVAFARHQCREHPRRRGRR